MTTLMNRPCFALVATLFALSGNPSAQGSERVMGDELAFARELAVRYQYIDLAEKVLGDLAKESLSSKRKENLALVHSQVYTEGAKREGDPKKRLEVFHKAADSFRAFFEKHPNSELINEAERSYLGLVNNYGRALELALVESVGEESEALRATIQSVLQDGLDRTATLKDAYDRPDLSAADKLQKWRLMLDRAQMLITLGNVSPDPEYLFSQADKELVRVATEAGETSGPGLNAFLALAKLNRSRGRFGDAADFADYVVKIAVPEDSTLQEWKELSFETKAERFKLVELAIPDLVESLAAKGDVATASNRALYFYNAWKREGFSISPFGYLAQLSAARVLLDAGGYVGGSMTGGNLKWFETEEEMAKLFSARDSRSTLELALKTAQDVNSENKGNNLQFQAQRLISDIISRPGVDVPPDVLLEAALGEYNSKNYAVAIGSMKDVLRALDRRDDATRRSYVPKVLYHVGASLARLERPLEAAMAAREVATTWKGDPEYQSKAASLFHGTIKEVRAAAKGDPLIEQLYLESERLVIEAAQSSGGSADSVTWQQAQRSYDGGKYDDARKSYLTIGQAADEHEKALVKAALCLYKKNDRDGAKKEFLQYLEGFVPDPRNAINGARKLAAREEARAQATYYSGKMAFDDEAWDEVIRIFTGYEREFPTQSDYAPNAAYMLVLAHLAAKDLPASRAAVATMETAFPKHSSTGKAALNLYQALKAEQEAAAAAGEDERARALTHEMARNVHLSNDAASEPNFSALRVEAGLWIELGEWVEAEACLSRTIALFGDQADRAADMERYVMPDMGQTLLGLKRVPEAFAVLDPLIPKDDSDPRKPVSAVVRNWCRSISGWIEGSGNETVEVPGVGGSFARSVELLNKLIATEANVNEPWACPWYGLKFELIYTLLQWSKADSSQREVAKRVLDDIVGQLGDPQVKAIGTSCGNDDLRSGYLWLRSQLR